MNYKKEDLEKLRSYYRELKTKAVWATSHGMDKSATISHAEGALGVLDSLIDGDVPRYVHV